MDSLKESVLNANSLSQVHVKPDERLVLSTVFTTENSTSHTKVR